MMGFAGKYRLNPSYRFVSSHSARNALMLGR
jgi:hypothetical protein